MSNAPDPQDGGVTAYSLWAVFRLPDAFTGAADTTALRAALDDARQNGVVVRGLYDVSGLRADAQFMAWLHGPDATALQAAAGGVRRALAPGLVPRWNAMGVHRQAEFSREHAPSFMKGLAPKTWVTVYPFVRSYEWYLLPEEERRGMLADHGRKGSQYPSVQANTVASFALGDYEWILALEAEDPLDLVDLMRHLRNTEARRHVREEIPFFTGRLIGDDELEHVLS